MGWFAGIAALAIVGIGYKYLGGSHSIESLHKEGDELNKLVDALQKPNKENFPVDRVNKYIKNVETLDQQYRKQDPATVKLTKEQIKQYGAVVNFSKIFKSDVANLAANEAEFDQRTATQEQLRQQQDADRIRKQKLRDAKKTKITTGTGKVTDPKKTKSTGLGWWWALIILLAAAAIGAGVWFFFLRDDSLEDEELVENEEC